MSTSGNSVARVIADITVPKLRMSFAHTFESRPDRVGAQGVCCPSTVIKLTFRWDSPESHIGIARHLRDTIPHAIILDQYSNPHNPLAHYYGTYPEIRSSLAESSFEIKHVSALFAGAGTGGTITGLARGIRDDEAEAGPSRKRARVVAIDPEGSILGGGDVVGNYEVEGIGYVSALLDL